ncbi:zinc finger protein castor homolog 1-like [Anneissia japonica]|uniref:zinc finger protein castor homolog 1-like n=1 Tax=Anneissia japonica TaxID=1529436 RepID=UPI00142580DE|nr:zinc finger protein castor homolog 1-like [Anneissia japonica]
MPKFNLDAICAKLQTQRVPPVSATTPNDDQAEADKEVDSGVDDSDSGNDCILQSHRTYIDEYNNISSKSQWKSDNYHKESCDNHALTNGQTTPKIEPTTQELESNNNNHERQSSLFGARKRKSNQRYVPRQVCAVADACEEFDYSGNEDDLPNSTTKEDSDVGLYTKEGSLDLCLRKSDRCMIMQNGSDEDSIDGALDLSCQMQDRSDMQTVKHYDTSPTKSFQNHSNNNYSRMTIEDYANRALEDEDESDEEQINDNVVCCVDEDGTVALFKRDELPSEVLRNGNADVASILSHDKDCEISVQSDEEKSGKMPEEVSVMKEYASTALDELFDMYGVEAEGREMMRHMPLNSFSLNNLLKFQEQEKVLKRAQENSGRTTKVRSSEKSKAAPPNKCNDDAADQIDSKSSQATQPKNSVALSIPRGKWHEDQQYIPDYSPPKYNAKSIWGRPVGGGGGPNSKKTVKQLIMEQALVKSEKLESFSKYDYLIQKLEAGEAISKDVPNLRISKYDSYIKRLQEGQSITQIINRKNGGSSQKVRDLLNHQLHQKANLPSNGDNANANGEMQTIDLSEHARSMRGPQYEALVQNILKAQGIDASTFQHQRPEAANQDSSLPQDLSMASERHRVKQHELELSKDSAPSYAAQFDGNGSMDESGDDASKSTSDVISNLDTSDGEPNMYMKYIAKYSATTHCKMPYCVYQYKEHYHCIANECKFARFTRKEDVVRHYNWHKRRDNSLQHGFMRFSPSDDCAPYYHNCSLNLKHTHYHCMQSGCCKVYTSTSDVLTHENYHKKNASLLNDGFQRFRATEDCGVNTCSFYGQKTTHFHCRRIECNFSFKNKCDIEKHKAFHIKDDQYQREGFKKFSKHEFCRFDGCRYSHNTNHFHCIRSDCDFTFTAANQMQSHRRKHERRQRIIAFEYDQQRRKLFKHLKPKTTVFRNLVTMNHVPTGPVMIPNIPNSKLVMDLQREEVPAKKIKLELETMMSENFGPKIKLEPETMMSENSGQDEEASSPEPTITSQPSSSASTPTSLSSQGNILSKAFAAQMEGDSAGMQTNSFNDSLNLPIPSTISPPEEQKLEKTMISPPIVKMRWDNKPEEIWQKYILRYTANDHCVPHCDLMYKGHYHCQVPECQSTFKSKDGVNKHARYHMMFEEAEEAGFHFFAQGESCEDTFKDCAFSPLAHYHCMWSLRPGIYCGQVVHTGSNNQMKPHEMKHNRNPQLEEIRDSYDDGKNELLFTTTDTHEPGFVKFRENQCTSGDCQFVAEVHCHCTRLDCNFTTNAASKMKEHKINENIAFESFKQFSRKMDCRRPGCKFNLWKKHFHCLHLGCNFSFLQVQQMESHGRKHMRRVFGKTFNKPGTDCADMKSMLHVIPTANINLSKNNGNSPPLTSSPIVQPVHHSYPAVSATTVGVTPSMRGEKSKPLPPFMIPLSPLDAEESPPRSVLPPEYPTPSGSASQSANSPMLAHWKVSPGKRPFTLIIEDPSKPPGYRRYKRGPIDDAMQERFTRYERNVNCGDKCCQFALNTTHYHCLHAKCNYKFAGKTMMYKHAQHHDRVDSIIQEDFERFKATVHCERPDCEFALKHTHFHCLRCPFICTDSAKVTAHRKQHTKSEVISSAGFKQFSSSESCEFEACKYSNKYSHYHCMRQNCFQAVLGMTMVEAHSRKYHQH